MWTLLLSQNPVSFCFNAKTLSLQKYPARLLSSFLKHKFTVFCNTVRQQCIKNLMKGYRLTKKYSLS